MTCIKLKRLVFVDFCNYSVGLIEHELFYDPFFYIFLSDWSDDDFEEMEKVFGDIQQRLNEVQQLDSDDSQIFNKGTVRSTYCFPFMKCFS